MKKGGIIGLLIAIGLLSFIVFYASKNGGSTLKQQLHNFAIEDTASITKVAMNDKNGNSLVLERISSDEWSVKSEGQDFKARQDVVRNLLKTIKELTVRAPVSKSRFEYTVKQIAANSTKVAIYQNEENSPAKVYYVGGANGDNTGTFMLLEKSSVPFLMHIEGHYGFIQSRYSPRINDWRDNAIWYFPGEKITKIKNLKVEYPQEPSKSFEITKVSNDEYTLKDGEGNLVSVPNMGGIYEYIKRYRAISYEGFEENRTKAYCDSLIAQTPVKTIYTLEDDKGNITQVKSYLKPAKEDAEDWEGNAIPYDLERMYATINNDQFVIIQYFVFDPLTVSLQEFSPPS
ncbi:DUF4340 domain-containing protein [Salibacteraceae bacterium]|nr:DUF4340 domain-containing protein [Bacteroidota bacterium]MDB0058080.1 DUF4340 domain-containing protein [Salibacteraceae bacterium]MDB9725634.1 DUF4340 domain-containing protein [Salibacteraceae bacterium]MDC1204011.1 DUF4340 domain-containing protein [Salibacteraceae bacterium]